MAALLFSSFTGASPGLLPRQVTCWQVEINTFGDDKNPRTCLVFWDFDGEVMDWRWMDEQRLPWQDRQGHWHVMWKEGRPVHVVGEVLAVTRTLHDVELRERDRWPDSKRRKLR